MKQDIDPAIERIYDAWHQTVKKRDFAATAALYAENAELETPLILAVYPTRRSGVLAGRTNIEAFFGDGARKFSSDLAQWFRSGTFFVNGRQLAWEYPRRAPKGDQVDLMEMMEIDADGLIDKHRVYWGWYGVRLLAPAIAQAASTPP